TVDVGIAIAMQLLYVLNTVHVTQKAHSISRLCAQMVNEVAAIVRVAGNGQNFLAWRLLKAFNNHASIVFRHQPAGDQVILSRFQAILPNDFWISRALDVSAVGNAG